MDLNLQELKAKVIDFANAEQDFLFNLKDRWKEEKQYEDFNDYVKVVKEALKDFNLELTSLSKSFHLKFNGINCSVTLKVNANGINLAWS